MFLHFLYWLHLFIVQLLKKSKHYRRRKPSKLQPSHGYRQLKKPEWVKKEIIRLKAYMPDLGCRKIADSFNQHYEYHKKTPMTIGKTYVGQIIKQYQHDILLLRQQTKHRIPKKMACNVVWAVDLTTVTDSQKYQNSVLGMMDHGARACLTLKELPNKSSTTLLRVLLDCIDLYGKPKYLRSDNEAVFVSRLFRFSLWLLNIKHQRIPKYSPWCNGRIERFFGTFKERINQLIIEDANQLKQILPEFRFWYNHVRTHQHLNGKTPAQVWSGKTEIKHPVTPQYYSTWDGLLTGYYFPPPE